MTQEELNEVLAKHKAWLIGEPGGERAYLNGADLSGASLGGADLRDANLRDADLSEANLSGADLSEANLRDADLSGADLSGADLRWASLGGADLSEANLRDADLSGANLGGANLSGADLRGSDLSEANLSGADLRGAIGLPDAPKIERLESTILAAIDAGGTLKMDAWHTCETTHCRAGWAITLAGEAGRKLEAALGANAAGALIYHASCGYVPDFYATNKDALADIRLRAAKEAV